MRKFIKKVLITKNNKLHIEEPEFVINNVQDWIEKEKPYKYMTEDDKRILPSIGTNINSVVRRGKEDNATYIFDRLIGENSLKDSVVVYRGVNDQNYERRLAQEHGFDKNYLYYNGYIFCTLNNDTYYWNTQTRMIISVPAGSHYLFTGEYSNTPESNEIILDKNSVLYIEKEEKICGKNYMWVKLIDNN